MNHEREYEVGGDKPTMKTWPNPITGANEPLRLVVQFTVVGRQWLSTEQTVED